MLHGCHNMCHRRVRGGARTIGLRHRPEVWLAEEGGAGAGRQQAGGQHLLPGRLLPGGQDPRPVQGLAPAPRRDADRGQLQVELSTDLCEVWL